MSYGPRFKIRYSNDLAELIEIDFDVLGYTGAVQTIQADGECLNIKSTTGDENKVNAICGTEATIKLRINAGDNVSIDDFIAPQDNFIRVTCFQDGNPTPIFQGFVVVEDNNQPLLDPPFVLTIRALDCLGTLQGIYFLDTNGNPFTGKQTIIGWLAQILNQTAQTLNLRTYFNIFNASFAAAQNPLEQICLDAITFETGQQTPAGDTNPADFNTGFDDYYTVLDKIVRNFKCKLFQEDGYWHLVNLWEYMNPAGCTYYEYSFGAPINGIIPYTLVGVTRNQQLAVSVGKTQSLRLAGEDALLYLKLATKSVELTYNYNQSLNKIINQDLSQGVSQPAQDEIISSTVIDTTYNNGVAINLQTRAYSAFGYIPMQAPANNGHANEPEIEHQVPMDPSNAFIRVVLDQLGNELLRFLVIKLLPSPNVSMLQTSLLLLDINDVLQINFSWRTRTGTNQGNSNWTVIQIWLFGDDGSHYSLGGFANGSTTQIPTRWLPTDSNHYSPVGAPQGQGSFITQSSQVISNTEQWSSIEVNTSVLAGVPFGAAPVSGSVQLMFYTNDGPGTEYWFKDLSVKILPFLNGAYQQLQGDYNYAESTANILATELDTVDISDSPKRYFQGALLSTAAGYVLLNAAWARSGYTESYRFGEIMAYLIYSNIWRICKKIEGTVKGLSYPDSLSPTGKSPSGMRNAYYFPDTNFPTKRFMLCSFDKDYNTGQWRGVFIETTVDQNDPGLKLPDFYEFSYLFTGL